ncbi:MAG: anti-sigma-E factor RseA [Edwardsiella tarda]|uniref:anti-sigma-E factor RseA n=1 Tax=Edwardsiella tarda TaxID=636 RepID=UPI003D2EC81F
MQKEKLSALMDGELLDSELIGSLVKDPELQQTWQRYHLVRDTLRGDVGETIQIDLTDRIAAALDAEPVRLVPNAIPESQPQPAQWQRMPFWHKVRPWVGQLSQMGIAAGVSLAVLLGVQHYNAPQEGVAEPESPVFNTLPLGGQASPVSFGVPNEGNNAQQQIQQQRKRINAILQDYELQRRLHAEQLQAEGNNAQASIQVPGTLSLGTQQQ